MHYHLVFLTWSSLARQPPTLLANLTLEVVCNTFKAIPRHVRKHEVQIVMQMWEPSSHLINCTSVLQPHLKRFYKICHIQRIGNFC
jgi:hypothetical protein